MASGSLLFWTFHVSPGWLLAPILLPSLSAPDLLMKLKIRNSKSKKAKKTGFLTRQRTSGGRKVNKRHRGRHGSF